MGDAFYTVAEDSAAGMLRARVCGFWSISTVESYVAILSQHFDRVRRRGGPVRLIIDATTLPTQQPEIGEHFLESWTTLLAGNDRVVMAVSSALAAMQARRICESERCHVVDSMPEAERWLASQS